MFAVRALLAQHSPGYLGQSSGNNAYGLVRSLPAVAVVFVYAAEVGIAANRHPGRFDKSPFQPLVAPAQHGTMKALASGGMG